MKPDTLCRLRKLPLNLGLAEDVEMDLPEWAPHFCAAELPEIRMLEKGGLSLRGDGFDGFGGSGKHLACLPNNIQDKEAAVLTVFGGFGGCGGFGRDGHPP